MKTVLYARTACANQANQRVNPNTARQVRSLKRYAEIKGMEVVGVYVDIGRSGANLIRPELKRLLSDAKKNKYDTVLVTDVARISRSLNDYIILCEELKKHNVKITFITPESEFVTSMKSILSEYYHRTRSQAIKEAMKKRSKQKAKTPSLEAKRSLPETIKH